MSMKMVRDGEENEERRVLASISADFDSHKHGNPWTYLFHIFRENLRKFKRRWINN